jgi:hypothetical protein
LDVLSSVKLGVNRPNSGADDRQRRTQASQHDGVQWVFQRRDKYPSLDNGDRNSGERNPKPNKRNIPAIDPIRYGRLEARLVD